MIKPALTSRDFCVMTGFSECICEGLLESIAGGTEPGECRFRGCEANPGVEENWFCWLSIPVDMRAKQNTQVSGGAHAWLA